MDHNSTANDIFTIEIDDHLPLVVDGEEGFKSLGGQSKSEELFDAPEILPRSLFPPMLEKEDYQFLQESQVALLFSGTHQYGLNREFWLERRASEERRRAAEGSSGRQFTDFQLIVGSITLILLLFIFGVLLDMALFSTPERAMIHGCLSFYLFLIFGCLYIVGWYLFDYYRAWIEAGCSAKSYMVL